MRFVTSDMAISLLLLVRIRLVFGGLFGYWVNNRTFERVLSETSERAVFMATYVAFPSTHVSCFKEK